MQGAFGAFGEGNPNFFTNNPHNPQQGLIEGSTLTLLSNNNMYNLNDPGLSNLITNTQHNNIKSIGMKYNFSRDMNYNLNYGDKKSNRYNFINRLLQPHLGSGLNKLIFLPPDPDELVDQ